MRSKSLGSVLLVEDNPGDARLLREMFREQAPENAKVTHVSTMREAEAALAIEAVDVVLLDLGLPDAQGVEAVRRAHTAAPRIPLVVLTGSNDEAMAVQTLQEGAQDYLVKGLIEARSLMRPLSYAVERKVMDDWVAMAGSERAPDRRNISHARRHQSGRQPDSARRRVRRQPKPPSPVDLHASPS